MPNDHSWPIWHMSPAKKKIVFANINNNLLDPYYPSSYTDGLPLVQSTGEAVFGGVWNVDEEGYIDEDDDFDDRTVPAAALLYPIFDKITSSEGDPKNVVGVFDLDFEFGPFLSHALPPNSKSITCVVSNCDQQFTYEVTGKEAVYLGAEDLHDTAYNDFMLSTLMTDFDKSPGGTVYNGAPVSKEFCPWKLTVYATKDLQDEFVTSNPVYYMLAVLGVFIFTCMTFIMYDRLVEFRQKKVMKSAVKSDNIVAELFPKTFREELYRRKSTLLSNEAGRRGKKGKGWEADDDDEFDLRKSLNLGIGNGGGPPMAELYPNCTVFFADIAGFTAWSSGRSPTQVFTLLEHVYGAFDKLARRHKVFKIETIGQ